MIHHYTLNPTTTNITLICKTRFTNNHYPLNQTQTQTLILSSLFNRCIVFYLKFSINPIRFKSHVSNFTSLFSN
ncbi:hypothetical protein QVD17_17045 [Tagetes erecta]|uniref:Uncharacterized protein n=1 Tax=Tagetes erecta TaxID=13708 RepID=A0AAD8KVZ4_TARER|nr:hypothetical protein QVD17_17045 [Tagetes erecta]